MTYRRYFICLVLSMLVSIGSVAFAGDPPNKLNYQGILSNSTGQPITGSVTVTFSLYNALTGGTAIWTEQQLVTLDKDGRFSVVLGSTKPLNPGLFTGVTYIGVKVGDDAEMPRQQLTSVAYALNASTATTAITAQKSLDTVQIPKGVIVMWSGTLATIPSGWALCDGNNGTPNLKDRFVVGAGNEYQPNGLPGGDKTINIAGHTHSIGAESPGTNWLGDHQHSFGGNTSETLNETHSVTDDNSNQREVAGDNHFHSYSGSTSWAGGHSHTVNSHSHGGATGSGGVIAFDNRPPYYALAYIMKL